VTLLLDTCTFLWIAQGSDELSPTARELFADPANDVYLSVVSAWEIAVKHALGRLPLPQVPERYVPQLRARHSIESLALEEAAVMQIAKLPGHHRDPFDRMLVCQALTHGFTLLTPDPLISRYPVRTAW
jgi:PIN domain nuclease of toxin-antitoxin system